MICIKCNNEGEHDDTEGQLVYCDCERGDRLKDNDAILGRLTRQREELMDTSEGFEVKLN